MPGDATESHELCGATKEFAGYGPDGAPWTGSCDREVGHDGEHWNGQIDVGWPRDGEEAGRG